MIRTPATHLLLALALASVLPTRALAQWSVALGVGSQRYWGGTIENAPERRSFHPYRPTAFTAGLERRAGSFAVALRLGYSGASMALEGSDALVALKGVFTKFSGSPEISYRLATLGGQNDVWLHAGPVVEIWTPLNESARVRVGAQGAISLRVPLARRFALSLAGDIGLVPSPFIQEDLEVDYALRPLWRRGVSAGLQYRL